jgi:hypothetical protein
LLGKEPQVFIHKTHRHKRCKSQMPGVSLIDLSHRPPSPNFSSLDPPTQNCVCFVQEEFDRRAHGHHIRLNGGRGIIARFDYGIRDSYVLILGPAPKSVNEIVNQPPQV